jgi:hypothetical protein
VTGVGVGDEVFGPAPRHWPDPRARPGRPCPRKSGLDPVVAAALPMAVGAACALVDVMGVGAGNTVLVHGAGSTTGYAAVYPAAFSRLTADVFRKAQETGGRRYRRRSARGQRRRTVPAMPPPAAAGASRVGVEGLPPRRARGHSDGNLGARYRPGRPAAQVVT